MVLRICHAIDFCPNRAKKVDKAILCGVILIIALFEKYIDYIDRVGRRQ